MVRNVLFCVAINCGVTFAMNCPVPASQSIESECLRFCDQAHLKELRGDTQKLRSSMPDKEFLLLIRGFANNLECLRDALSSLRQENSSWSPAVRYRYGRELGSFLVGTENLFIRRNIKNRLIKLGQTDLVEQFANIGVL